MEKDQIIELKIDDMLDDGRAFGRHDGCAVFVSGGCGENSVSHGGGVDSKAPYYAGAVPGDLALVKITKTRKSSAEARLLEVREPSPDRIRAECPYFGKCGGCTLQELSYEAQKSLKTGQIRSKLARLGGIENPKINDMIGADKLKYYRNKAVFAVGPHGEVGFLRRGSHHVMDIEDCMLQSDAAMVCADALRTFLREHGGSSLGIGRMTVRTAFGTGEVMVVLEEAAASDGSGNKRSRGSKRNNKTGIRFEIPDIEALIGMLDDAVYSLNAPNIDEEASGQVDEEASGQVDEQRECFYSLESVALVYGADPKEDKPGKCTIAAGRPTITEEVTRGDGKVLRFEISPQSFYQVNPEQMVKLYDKAMEYALGAEVSAADSGNFAFDDRADVSKVPEYTPEAGASTELRLDNKKSSLLDLYCGVGTIGIWMADHFEQVIGIESVRPAVIDANRNSVINGLINTRYIAGKAEEELPGMMGLSKLYKWNEVNERVEREPEIKLEHADVAVIDPPRAGCAEPLLAAAVTASPDRIVYVSCDPGTLARDIKYLTAHGYEFIEATPVDQFVWSSHIEVVAKIQRR